MIKEAAQVTYTDLVDRFDPDDPRGGIAPSFSVSWFDAFMRRYRISCHQLYGEAGRVDLEAIEPRLREIRTVCATYTVDDIFDCYETGIYLKELFIRSYTVPEEKVESRPTETVLCPPFSVSMLPLERRTLLLLDSCPAHNDIDDPDPAYGWLKYWKYLRVERLPKNSTSVTQPLDIGIINVFKRALLELLSSQTSLARTYDKNKAISNGYA